MAKEVLRIEGLKVNYGSIKALKGIDLDGLALEEIIRQALKKMVK